MELFWYKDRHQRICYLRKCPDGDRQKSKYMFCVIGNLENFQVSKASMAPTHFELYEKQDREELIMFHLFLLTVR